MNEGCLQDRISLSNASDLSYRFHVNCSGRAVGPQTSTRCLPYSPKLPSFENHQMPLPYGRGSPLHVCGLGAHSGCMPGP